MSNSKNLPKQNMKIRSTVEIMYQNLQGAWYAFADVEGEVYFAKVPLKCAVEKDDKTALAALKKVSGKNL